MSEGEYGLVRSFGIDGNELEGVRPQEIFVLGYELAQVDAAIAGESAVTMMVHSANKSRIESECKRVGRKHRLTWLKSDQSEEWMQLELEETN